MLIAANFSDSACVREWPREAGKPQALILSNLDSAAAPAEDILHLEPYEAVIIRCQ